MFDVMMREMMMADLHRRRTRSRRAVGGLPVDGLFPSASLQPMFLPLALLGRKYCDTRRKWQAHPHCEPRIIESIITLYIIRDEFNFKCMLLLHVVLQS